MLAKIQNQITDTERGENMSFWIKHDERDMHMNRKYGCFCNGNGRGEVREITITFGIVMYEEALREQSPYF